MILDAHGTPIRRKMGFLRGYTSVKDERMEANAIGSSFIRQVEEPEEDEELLRELGGKIEP